MEQTAGTSRSGNENGEQLHSGIRKNPMRLRFAAPRLASRLDSTRLVSRSVRACESNLVAGW